MLIVSRRCGASKSTALTNHGDVMPSAASNTWLLMLLIPSPRRPPIGRADRTTARGRTAPRQPGAQRACGFVDGAFAPPTTPQAQQKQKSPINLLQPHHLTHQTHRRRGPFRDTLVWFVRCGQEMPHNLLKLGIFCWIGVCHEATTTIHSTGSDSLRQDRSK